MIGVCSTSHAYRVATSELPMSARQDSRAEGAIVVVQDDQRWAQSARAAFEAGAVAVIVTNPGPVIEQECARLQDAARGRPIIVNRPLLRADLVDTASAHVGLPSYVAVDLATTRGRRADVARDAAGWMRVLAGGNCEVLSADRVPSASLALMQREDSAVSGVLSATTITGADEGAWIRAIAVAETRVEVVLDEADAQASVDIATAEGILRSARRFETPERLSLRRAIHAVASSESVLDLADLRTDAAVASVFATEPADKQH